MTNLNATLGESMLSLCYEVHGKADEYFNLISDAGLSVNAHYVAVNDYLNVIGLIGVVAVDSAGVEKEISVDLNGCMAEVDGVNVTRYSSDGTSLRKYSRRVRISVPNCDGPTVVMWVVCQNNILSDPFTGDDIQAEMIKFVVARGLNLSPQSHGLIGKSQFHFSLIEPNVFCRSVLECTCEHVNIHWTR